LNGKPAVKETPDSKTKSDDFKDQTDSNDQKED
jgi:hypothetical protein